MDNTEKYIRLIEIASQEYQDKHRHFWSVYWKFLTVIAFITSLYIFNERNIGLYIQANQALTTAIFIALVMLIGFTAFFVMCREHIHLTLINKRREQLYAEIGVTPFPEDSSRSLLKPERFIGNITSIAACLSMSILAFSLFCALLVFLSFKCLAGGSA